MTTLQMLAGRYERGAFIGGGTMGDVYEGTDKQTGKRVAIKALKTGTVQRDPDLVTRFKREGEALRELNHPNIVTLLDAVEEDGRHYLVMEYVSGGDLSDLLRNTPQLPIDQALTIAIQLADALTRAHFLNIIHRDLKPANVLIAADGTPRLSDFGVAHFIDQAAVTQAGTIIGTVPYLSPEACTGEPLDERADIWAFGVLLFEMLAGRRPFDDSSPAATIIAILSQPVPDLCELRDDVSDDLNDLVYRMLEKQREGRIPSVRLVGAALEALMKGDGLTSSAIPVAPSVFAPPPIAITERPRQNLPRQALPFVGREDELRELARLLTDPDQPQITILGPGGMGKSRLALEAAERNLESFRNGAFFVGLAKLSDAANIPGAIATAIDYRFSDQGTPEEQLLNYLANKQMLLILDNFEHILAGVDLVAAILEKASEVTVLATSRERLNLSAETVFVLDPLDFPDWETPEDALHYSAVQLFMQSARRAQIDFALTEGNLDHVARICRLVGGIPLGILLAGAWVDILSPEEIANGITQSVDFLEADLRDLPARQRSMRAAFDSSWNLLNDDERAAFAKMAVFRGGCTREAAQAVTGASLRMLTALVNKSLLRRGAESGRFHIHELLRQLGEEQLEASGEAEAIRDAHSSYYLNAAAEREADLKGRDQLRALDAIESDFENVRAAWGWAVDHKDHERLQAALTGLYLTCEMRSRFVDGEALFREGGEKLAKDGHPVWGRMVAAYEQPLRRFGQATADSNATADSLAAIEQALEITRQHGDQAGEAFALFALARRHMDTLSFREAIALLEESLALYQSLQDTFFQGGILHTLGLCYYFLNDVEGDKKFTQQALDLRRETGDLFGVAASLNNLAVVKLSEGDLDLAGAYHRESYAIRQALGDRYGVARSGGQLCITALRRGNLKEAQRLAHEAMALATDINDVRLLTHASVVLGLCFLFAEDYQQAKTQLERALALPTTDPQVPFYARANLAESCIGLGDLDAARQHLQAAFKWADYFPIEDRGGLLYYRALLVTHEGRFERAAELLALAHATTPWVPLETETLPLARLALARLQAELPPEAFEAAWERGEAMDVDEELRKEFGEFLTDAD